MWYVASAAWYPSSQASDPTFISSVQTVDFDRSDIKSVQSSSKSNYSSTPKPGETELD